MKYRNSSPLLPCSSLPDPLSLPTRRSPPVAASASVAVLAANLNLPTVTITNGTGPSRAAVQAEAVEFVKHHKTALAVQLEQYKN